MSDMNEMNRAGRHAFVGSVWFVLIVVFVVGILTFVLLKTRPWIIEQEREQTQRSQQYVETQQEELLHLAQEWQAADENMRPALETRMRAMANRISAEDVPPEAQEILQ